MLQMGFFDLSDRYASLDTKKNSLVEIKSLVPWEELRPTLEGLCASGMMTTIPAPTAIR